MVANFSPAEYFGSDGSDPTTGPWSQWFHGKVDFFDRDHAEFMWWHLCEMQSLFVEIGAVQGTVDTTSPDGFESSINRCLCAAETHLGHEIQLVNPFEFDCDMIGLGENGDRMSVLALLAYAIWCIDRMIDALRASNAKVTEQLERLEAMFHAIRGELDRDCYAYQIADLGQEVASGYAATMKKIAEMEASHG
ncbi:hypothetical protein [Burkholderia contaminans]|uniref:hypothetical protein n=1 Tax=Burkholderia contaminans TaxID=488447 RepID=UPI003D66CBF3